MKKPRIPMLMVAVLAALLSACSGTPPVQTSGGGSSGVTVFGTIDTNISRTSTK